jgi:hypothetical protein
MKHLHNDTGTGGGDTAAPDDSAGAAAPDDSANPAPQSSEPTYGNSSRQNLDQLIQNSGN